MKSGRCRNHGGGSLSGTASGTFKHGKYSKSLPAQVATRCAEALSDPELLSLRGEVALVQARISELVERLSTGESGSFYGAIRAAWSAFRSASAAAAPDADAQREALTRLDGLILAASSDESAWRELRQALYQKARLASMEVKRLVDLRQVITAERATVWAMRLLQVVLDNVPDPSTRRVIAREYEAMMNAPDTAD